MWKLSSLTTHSTIALLNIPACKASVPQHAFDGNKLYTPFSMVVMIVFACDTPIHLASLLITRLNNVSPVQRGVIQDTDALLHMQHAVPCSCILCLFNFCFPPSAVSTALQALSHSLLCLSFFSVDWGVVKKMLIPCWRHILWLSCQVVHVDEQLRLMPQVNSDKVLLLRHVMAIFCWSLLTNYFWHVCLRNNAQIN